MAKADTKIPAEFVQLSSENVRGMAEKGLAQSREAYEKLNASAKEAAVSLEASATIVAKGLSALRSGDTLHLVHQVVAEQILRHLATQTP